MKSGFNAATTIAAAMAIAIAATTASAGVVISEELVTKQNEERKTEQTVMVQGHKQKVIVGDQEIVTDLDAAMIYIIMPKTKQFSEMKFPPTGTVAMKMVWEGSTVELKNSGGADKVAGYACQDYTGSASLIRHIFKVTKCVASSAPGAREFVEFQKAMADKLKGTHLMAKSEIPDGIPVSSTVITTLAPYRPRGGPPGMAAKINEALAKYKPVISTTTVSKIEVKEIPADAFAVPAGYTKWEMPKMPQIGPNLGKLAGSPGAAPAAPAAPAAAPAAPAPPAPAPAPH